MLRARGIGTTVGAIAIALSLHGCDGKVGPQGPQGAQGDPGQPGAPGDKGTPAVDKGTIAGTVTFKKLDGTTANAGSVSVTATPVGTTTATATATTGANGTYTLPNLPVGYYNVVLGSDPADGYDATTLANIAVTAGVTVKADGVVTPTNALDATFSVSVGGGSAAAVNAPPAPFPAGGTPTVYQAGFGKAVALTITPTGAPAGSTPTVKWTWLPGPYTQKTPGVGTGNSDDPTAPATGTTLTFTTPKLADRWDPDPKKYGKVITNASPFASIIWDRTNVLQLTDFPNVELPLRVEPLAIPQAVEKRLSYTFKATVTAGDVSKSFTVVVNTATYSGASVAPPANNSGLTTISNGRYIVPVKQNVVLSAPRLPDAPQGVTYAYKWTLVGVKDKNGNALTSTATLDFPAEQFVTLVPDVEGIYTVKLEIVDGSNNVVLPIPGNNPVYHGATVEVVAASYIGSEGGCAVCHANDAQTAAWRASPHAAVFKDAIDGLHGSTYDPVLMRRNTTGYFDVAGANGFADRARTASYALPAIPATPTAGLNSDAIPAALKPFAGVGCESCHGPGSMHNGTPLMIGQSLSSDSCNQCHNAGGEYEHGMLHLKSGHAADMELALDDATVDARNSTASHCGRCHNAAGYRQYMKQVALGNPGNLKKDYAGPGTGKAYADDCTGKANGTCIVEKSPVRPDGDPTLINLGMTRTFVEPDTCASCHDPHTQKIRTELDSKWEAGAITLPAGFQAPGGMGTGVVCASCHNTRNGTATPCNSPAPGAVAPDAIARNYSDVCTTWQDPSNVVTWLHEDDPAGTTLNGVGSNSRFITGFTAPHSPAQADVFSGHNAFFVGTGAFTGNLSKHASVKDTCVGCHVNIPGAELDVLPPGFVTSGGKAKPGANHTFLANNQVCSACHSSNVNGAALQHDVEEALHDVSDAVWAKLWARLDHAVKTQGLTITLWDRATDGDSFTPVEFSQGANFASWPTSRPKLELNGVDPIKPFDTEVHGQMSVCFPAAAPITNNGQNIKFILGTADSTIALKITTGGGSPQFTYQVNGGTVSSPVAVPASLSFTVPGTNVTLSLPRASSSKYTLNDTWTITQGGTVLVPGASNTSTAWSARITQPAKPANEICFQLGNAKMKVATPATVAITMTSATTFDYAVNGGSTQSATIASGKATINVGANPSVPETSMFETFTFSGTYAGGETFTFPAGSADGTNFTVGAWKASVATTFTNGGTLALPADVLPKALWNYYLLHGDGSKGVHNPSFVYSVILATLNNVAAVPSPPTLP